MLKYIVSGIVALSLAVQSSLAHAKEQTSVEEQLAWQGVACEATYMVQLMKLQLAYNNIVLCNADPLSFGCDREEKRWKDEAERLRSLRSICDKL